MQQKVYQCVEAVSLSLVSVQMPGLFCCAFGGYPARNTFRAHLHSAVFQARLASEPRAQAFNTSQSVCCKRVKYRILSYCKVQMLPFSTASEPVEMLVATVQQKVYQCVETVSLSFVPVQMPGLFCCAFCRYPFSKCLQGVFAFCGVPNPVGI